MKFDRVGLFYLASALPVGALVVCAAAAAPPSGSPTPAGDTAFTQDVLPIVQTYCLGCHSGNMPAGGNLLFLDGHNEWKKFGNTNQAQYMVVRTTGGPSFWF